MCIVVWCGVFTYGGGVCVRVCVCVCVCVCVTDEVACVDPEVCQCICENPNGCSNIAYPLLVLRILSPGKVNYQGSRSNSLSLTKMAGK